MMSWYSRDKQCQLQLADLSFSLPLSAPVSGSLRIDTKAFVRQPTIHSKAPFTCQGVYKSYNKTHKKLDGGEVAQPYYTTTHAQINKAFIQDSRPEEGYSIVKWNLNCALKTTNPQICLHKKTLFDDLCLLHSIFHPPLCAPFPPSLHTCWSLMQSFAEGCKSMPA